MRTVTFEEIKKFDPCWLYTEKGRKRLEYYGRQRERWTALDVLALKRVSLADRLWAVLREDFIDAPILHEFACRCAERALSRVERPDPRSVAGIQAKRDWLQGKITDEELADARDAAWAAARDAADAARAAAWAAEEAAWAAENAAGFAAEEAARAARDVAWWPHGSTEKGGWIKRYYPQHYNDYLKALSVDEHHRSLPCVF